MKKRVVTSILMVVISMVVLILLQELFMPKYITSIQEGNLIEEYYKEEKDHDVIVIGDCEVFANVSPITLWEKYGITSFIRGSAQQLVWQSYYLLEEVLQYEKPEVVIFNVLALKYNEPQNEAYNRLTLDGMRLSKAKLRSMKASMMEEEDAISYLFPFLRYHSRWNALTAEDFRYWFSKKQVSHNGYLMRVDTKPVTSIPSSRKLANYQFGDNAYEYLDKMAKLCKENGIQLMLIKSPSVYPHWYEEWDEQMVAYAKENDLVYVNFLDYVDDMEIDYTKDTYDSGLHLNLAGAEKFTTFLGQMLVEKYGLESREHEDELAKIWEDKVKFYYDMKADQEYELASYGYLKSYGASENINVKE